MIAEVIADSKHPLNGSRLITLRLVIPTVVLAQFNTHRALSKNAGSMRAIPTKRLLKTTLSDPAFPPEFGANKPGMQAGAPIRFPRLAKAIITGLLFTSVVAVWLLQKLGGHKQWVSRYLTPWTKTTVIATGTGQAWRHFLGLRAHKDADPAIRVVAEAAQIAIRESIPTQLQIGDVHKPFGGSFRQSVARCARTSLATFDAPTKESTELEDFALYRKLVDANPPHMSPTEHQAECVASSTPAEYRNFCSGWVQLRSKLDQPIHTSTVAV